MQKIEMLLRFLRYTTGMAAYCLDEAGQIPEEIEQKHCFSPQAQPLLTARGLRDAFPQVRSGSLYEIADLLGLHSYLQNDLSRT